MFYENTLPSLCWSGRGIAAFSVTRGWRKKVAQMFPNVAGIISRAVFTLMVIFQNSPKVTNLFWATFVGKFVFQELSINLLIWSHWLFMFNNGFTCQLNTDKFSWRSGCSRGKIPEKGFWRRRLRRGRCRRTSWCPRWRLFRAAEVCRSGLASLQERFKPKFNRNLMLQWKI